MQLERLQSMYSPQGYLVITGVNDESSLTSASSLLSTIIKMDASASKTLILVANKADLIQARVLSPQGS